MEGLGVASVFPVGYRGCRVLRGIPVVLDGVGVTGGCGVCVRGATMSSSGSGVVSVRRGLLGGGSGDGLLGPRGRRSDEFLDIDRDRRGGESMFEGVTVHWLLESLDAREAGRVGWGGSSAGRIVQRQEETETA